ncbi:MAG: O-antigen ligase family protein [Phycisphaerales bacterium]|nr:O-antigen ligase family protein [Phycisphaerales bacterium]
MFMAMAWAMSLPIEMVPGLKDITLGCLAGWVILRMMFGGVSHIWHCLYKSPLLWILLALPCWSLITCIWSDQPIWGLEEVGAMRGLVAVFVVYPVLHHITPLIISFLGGVLIVNAVQILQVADLIPTKKHSYRFAAGGSPNPLGLLLSGGVVIATTFALTSKHKSGALIWSFVTAITFSGIVLVQNRGGILAASIACIVVTIVGLAIRHTTWARVPLVVLSGASSLVLLIGIDATFFESRGIAAWTHQFEQTMHEVQSDDVPAYKSSIGIRKTMWAASMQLWESHPIVGLGAGGMGMHLEVWPDLTHFNEIDKHGKPIPRDFHPHSTWCWILASTGLIGGLLLFAMLVLTSIAYAQRLAAQPIMLASIGLLTAWCIANTFDSLLLTGQTAAMLGLILCGAFSEPSTRSDLGIRQQPPC